MKRMTKMTSFDVCHWMSDLDSQERDLVTQAIRVRDHAQAPYSHYHVGAALRSATDHIYVGCNVERASYTQTSHGEQNAIDSMVAAEGPTKIAAMAIVGAPKSFVFSVPVEPQADAQARWSDVCPSCG